jgi:hypothetical protein
MEATVGLPRGDEGKFNNLRIQNVPEVAAGLQSHR